jgi:hypothetical protein
MHVPDPAGLRDCLRALVVDVIETRQHPAPGVPTA